MRTAAVSPLVDSTRNAGLSKDPSTRNPILSYSPEQLETARYIADMVLELRNMAKGAALYATMVPLEYAYYEAFSVANRVLVPPEEAERLKRLGEEARGVKSSDMA